MLYDLVLAFDDEDGVSSAIFSATMTLVRSMMCVRAAEILSQYMDASEERYYFKDGQDAITCWHEMCDAQKNGPGRRLTKPKPK